MGTAGYMSPEQVRGEKLDARTDLFSFGLVLYVVATGQQAFTGDTVPALHNAILTHTPVSARQLNPALPAKLEAIINRALEKDREARYQRASEMRSDLQALKQGLEPRLRAPWRAVAASVVAVGIIASSAWWWAKRQQRSPVPPEIKFRQLTSNSSESSAGGNISPDGRYLAYIDRAGIHLKLIETGEAQTIPQPAETKDKKPSWAVGPWFPDGTRFLLNAYPRFSDPETRHSRGASIWIASVLGGPPHKIRDEAEVDDVSPDGSLIVFEANASRSHNREVWTMRPDGEEARKVFESDENGGVDLSQWLPGGQRIAYGKWSQDKFVFVIGDLKGGPLTTIVPPATPSGSNYLWLPDGRLVYQTGEFDADFPQNLWQGTPEPANEYIRKASAPHKDRRICGEPQQRDVRRQKVSNLGVETACQRICG